MYRLDVQPKAPMDRVRLRENKDETGVVQQRHSDHAAGGIVPQHGGIEVKLLPNDVRNFSLAHDRFAHVSCLFMS